MFRFRERLVAARRRAGPARHARARQDPGRGAGVGPARHRDGRVRLRHSQPDHGPDRCRTSPGRSTARRSATRSASAWGSRPFNFPVMVPLWMFPVAITCGNTFVLKPSEKVPLSAVRLGELLMESGLPRGRLQHRARRQGVRRRPARRIPWSRAVSFVGSTAVARHVYETGTRNGKRVQAAGGAKNHLIIMPDADLDQAVGALQLSAFGCAGERCMAGSVAVPVGERRRRLVERLCDRAGRMKVGPTDGGAEVDMGPVITREHLRPRGRLSRHRPRRRGRGRRSTAASTLPTGDGFLIGPSVLDRVEPGDAGRPRGDLRPGALGRPRRRPRRGAGHRPRLPLRQRRVDLHPQRLGGPRSSSITSTPG